MSSIKKKTMGLIFELGKCLLMNYNCIILCVSQNTEDSSIEQ